MKQLAMLDLDESLFEAMREVCARDPDFPSTWSEWQRLMEAATAVAREQGGPPPPVSVRPATFRTWCERVGVVPGLDALRAYAMAARTPAAPLAKPRQRDSKTSKALR